jgi:lipoprotein NlpI
MSRFSRATRPWLLLPDRVSRQTGSAFFNRGLAYVAKQDSDRAIADYNEAIRIDTKSARAFFYRGIAYAAKQDSDRAIADYNEAIRLDPKYPNSVLWLYFARTRSGAHNAAAELATNAKNLKQPDWPYPVVELFLGRRTPEATLAAATKPNDRCEAQFYIGEWHLLRGDHPKAIAALNAAVDTCPKLFVEFLSARAELKRLRP